MGLAVAILACGDIAVVLLMTVDATQIGVLFLAAGETGIYALVTAGTHIVGYFLPVLNIGG